MNKKCLIISGGEKSSCPDPTEYDLIIAADKGAFYADQFGVVPDIVIGDLDSFPLFETAGKTEFYKGRDHLPELQPEIIEEKTVNAIGNDHLKVLMLPSMKDDTDTMAAVRYALGNGYLDITICCIMGGRFDHMLAGLQTAVFIAEHGGTAKLIGTGDEIYVYKNTAMTFPKKAGWSLSVLSLSENSTGICITGTVYPADNLTLSYAVPLGMSNSWTEENAVVRVENGVLAVVLSKLESQTEE